MTGVAAVRDRWRRHYEVSILISVGACVGRCFGSQPRAKVSMMITRPPQQGHGGSTRGSSSAVASDVSGCSERDGTASNLRACAMLVAGCHWQAARNDGCGGSPWVARASGTSGWRRLPGWRLSAEQKNHETV
jgi:hypothetical protein